MAHEDDCKGCNRSLFIEWDAVRRGGLTQEQEAMAEGIASRMEAISRLLMDAHETADPNSPDLTAMLRTVDRLMGHAVTALTPLSKDRSKRWV